MVMLDANIILRYLLDDNEEMSQKAEEYIKNGDAIVTTEVIAEVVYVLGGVYDMDKEKITSTINSFLDLVRHQDKNVVKHALYTFGSYSLDFVDCVLFSYHKLRGYDIATFDNKLLKLMKNNSDNSSE